MPVISATWARVAISWLEGRRRTGGPDSDVGAAIVMGLALAMVLIGLCMAFVAAGPIA
jgi:hypothetical protein